MKKLLLVIVLLLTTLANAQSFGIKGGVNFAGLKGDDADSFKGLTSYHIGVLKEFVIFSKLSLQPELLYSVQGAKLDNTDEEYKLNYLTLPVVLKIYITDAFSVHAGPQFGLLLGETKDVPVEGKTFDYGAAIGLDYALSNSFFVQGRYYAGLTEMTDDADIRNSVIQLSIGVTF